MSLPDELQKRLEAQYLFPDVSILRGADIILANKLGITLVPCTGTQCRDMFLPPWLNPYDRRVFADSILPGRRYRSMYEERMSSLHRHHGAILALEIMRTEQVAFLQGNNDVRGNHWCGHCLERAKLINLGDTLGFPALPCVQEGYVSWKQFASTATDSRIFEALYHASHVKKQLVTLR
ncbi:hypothetical protein EI42_04818 [Thermosporothrix hazakensis]|jgi:hypothetical protein|uniref:Uncharacterized protein n=1 Tax=Thermosporothrix hazakensis TaxID=644383 RepID=A0A326U1Q5_THEHA|nr:hypothetical protein EI42_04818 [Thermosporothrix hazakensis]